MFKNLQKIQKYLKKGPKIGLDPQNAEISAYCQKFRPKWQKYGIFRPKFKARKNASQMFFGTQNIKFWILNAF